jgi:polyisoprenoid-binding protein YceI
VTDEDLARTSVSVSIEATTTIDRNDFGVSFNAPFPGRSHAMLLSDSVAINLDVEAVLQTDSSTS